MEDGPVLFYCKGGILYPVGMSAKDKVMFEMAVRVIEPLKVDFAHPQGKVVDLKAEGSDRG